MIVKWYSIGSLSFPASWAAIAAAFIGAYLFLRLQRKKRIADVYSNAFFIFFVTWKLSVILFHFQTTIRNPLSIIYFNGGIKGYWLGVAAAFLYLILSAKKADIPEKGFHIQVWVLIITVYELVFYLLNDGHILLSGLHLAGNIIIFVLMKRKMGNILFSIQLLVLFTCFQALIYSLAGNLVSVPIMTYTAGAMILGWSAYTYKGREKDR